MRLIHNLNKRERNFGSSLSLKRTVATVLTVIEVLSASTAYASDDKNNKSQDNNYPVIGMLSTDPIPVGQDDSVVVFDPDISTKPTSLEIDENATDEEKLEVYYNDMLANGLQSEGTRRLICWFVGPLTGLKVNYDSTINDSARELCVKNYSGKLGKDRWAKGKKYIKPLYNLLNEECSKVPNRKAIDDKWTKIGFSTKTLTPEDKEETLCVITHFIKYFIDNNPTKIADEVLLKNFENSGLESKLFDLRVKQFIKKKSLIYKGQ